MVFVGNMNENISTLLLQASLFKPFPVGMNEDTAFLDRIHCYIPGWEIEPFSPKYFTNDYGFICDYLAEISRELRKLQYSSMIDQYFKLDESLKQRDVAAIRKMFSAMVKIIYPNGQVDKQGICEILEFVMEMRSRVKEQLNRIQPDGEFSDARFAYYDLETNISKEVLVPECTALSTKN
jgi:ATP-dependent Lon protease